MHSVTVVPSASNAVFYPIGNTPAINLLKYHTPNPDSDTATEILLLACGDLRSILYSLYCEGKPDKPLGVQNLRSDPGKFNFTCCDLEPAVLARNVLLLSAMIDYAESYNATPLKYDDTKISTVWNLCYHIYISQQDLEVVRSQATKLLQLSETAENWVNSPYGSLIKVVSLQTAVELRNVWKQYAEIRSEDAQKGYEDARRAEVKATYDQFYAPGPTQGRDYTFFPGPHWLDGLDISNHALYAYWRTGVTAGNDPDVQALGDGGLGRLNPLFCISSVSEKFITHFHSNPFAGFHLAQLFDVPVKNTEAIVKAMVETAKTQFMDWSKAFIDYAKSDSVLVNVYYGDAVTFCHELAGRDPLNNTTSPITRCYTTQWSIKPLALDGDGAKALPKSFDVIDTSNLADWIGMHNLLLATSQLLSQTSSAVLYTETLRLTSQEPEDNLKESLFMDVDLACVLYGIAPIDRLVGYTTNNNSVEDLIHEQDSPSRYRMQIAWKVTALADQYARQALANKTCNLKVSWGAEELANRLFQTYLLMFAPEDITGPRSGSRKEPSHLHIMNPYIRLSFVTLLKQALRTFDTDWPKFIKILLDFIRDDDTLIGVGESIVTDLVLHMDTSGFMQDVAGPQRPTTVPGVPHKFVSLIVPRKKMKIFEKLGGTPCIHLSIIRDDPGIEESHFFSLDCFFGRFDSEGVAREDPLGWKGTKDLVVTTIAPVELVSNGSWVINLKVTLAVGTARFMFELGPDNNMVVYKASNDNKRRVHVSSTPPGIPSNSPRMIWPPKALHRNTKEFPVTLKAISFGPTLKDFEFFLETKSLYSFVATWKLTPGTPAAIALCKKETPITGTLQNTSPCSMLVKIGSNPKHTQHFIFPFPINGIAAKTRIARKSLWIEVTAPLSNGLCPGGFDDTPFPLDLSGPQPKPWSLPRLNLRNLPRVILPSNPSDAEWLSDFAISQISVREKNQLIAQSFVPKILLDHLLYWKRTLDQIVQYHSNRASDIPPGGHGKMKMFALMGKDASNSDMFIIPSCLRHGRETGSIIIDGWFVALTVERGEKLIPGVPVLPRNDGSGTFCGALPCRKEEIQIWKNLMPAAVESCRRNWKHRDDCEYKGGRLADDTAGGARSQEPKAPVSTEPFENPICTCGEAMDLEGWPMEEGWMQPFRDFAVRVALSSLSGVSCLERMTSDFESDSDDSDNSDW